MNEELTNEALEAMKKCNTTNCEDCPANKTACIIRVRHSIEKLATALLEERAKPKFWDGAPDNAGRGIVNWFDKNGVYIDNGMFTRELPKTRARQIAEEAVRCYADSPFVNSRKTDFINVIESALNKYAEELEGKHEA